MTNLSNLPSVSIKIVILVAKFAAGVVDTRGKFATGVIDTGVLDTGGALDLRISPRIFENFETVLIGYSGAGGKLIHEKTEAKNLRTMSL